MIKLLIMLLALSSFSAFAGDDEQDPCSEMAVSAAASLVRENSFTGFSANFLRSVENGYFVMFTDQAQEETLLSVTVKMYKQSNEECMIESLYFKPEAG